MAEKRLGLRRDGINSWVLGTPDGSLNWDFMAPDAQPVPRSICDTHERKLPFAVSISDHVPRARADRRQENYQTLSTGRTEANARKVLSQRVTECGHGFIVVRYLVNLDNYGEAGQQWSERITFGTKQIRLGDGSESTVHDRITFEVLSQYDAVRKPIQRDGILLFLDERGEAPTRAIADHLGTTPARVSNVLGDPQKEGLVNKGDGKRGVPHSLTEQGIAEAIRLTSA